MANIGLTFLKSVELCVKYFSGSERREKVEVNEEGIEVAHFPLLAVVGRERVVVILGFIEGLGEAAGEGDRRRRERPLFSFSNKSGKYRVLLNLQNHRLLNFVST